MRVRIPKSVDKAWDWTERNAKRVGAVLLLVIAGVGALWMPALGALAAGVLIGALVTLWRTRRAVAALRADNDQLLRENGAMRHALAALEHGVRRQGSVETQVLPFIPAEEE